MRVAIIGGGIGGLCLAQGLKSAGVPFTIYERDATPDARLQGYRLNIEPIGARALHGCLPPDLWTRLIDASGSVGDGMGVFDEQLHELMREPTPPAGLPPEERTHAMSRITLRDILLSGVDTTFGKEFVRYDVRAGGTVVATFADGTTTEADILVGADGVGSRVRKQLLPTAGEVDAPGIGIGGKLDLASVESWMPAPLLRGKSMILPPRDFLFTAVFSPHYMMWAFVANTASLPAQRSNLRELVKQRAASWSPALRRIFDETPDDTIEQFQFRAAARVASLPSGPVTLLGDAIHYMPPVGGLGGNMALADAVHLRDALVGHTSLDAYQTAMLQRGFGAVDEARRYLRLAISPSPLMRWMARAFFRTCGVVPPLRNAIFGS